mgnify:CR=1 FL=1
MSYMALYRKWRPVSFEDVKGQDPVVQTLKNQITSDRIGHAYLFCGTRGTGKTSIAKIYARAVNCEHPIDGSPCNQCASCRAILEGSSMNVVEIDAASNNGVENIRDIREQVQYPPTEGKYRVYIIDEVHMLSIGAFNSLLKTLEEPPAYVIFILATTEVHKIPITILSRCQRYDFKRISLETIADRLRELTQAEHIQAEDKALMYIAKAADGSLRDGLSLLDQCVAFHYGKLLTYENALEVLGAVDSSVFSRMFNAVADGRTRDCITELEEIVIQGRELGQFVTDFIWYLRNLMLVQTADQSAQALEMTKENYEALREESKMVALSVLMRNIRICSELSNQLKFAVSKRVLIEMAIIKMMQPQMEDDIESLRVRLDQIEEKIASGSFVNNTEPQQSGSIFDSYFEGDAKQPVMQKAAQTVELSEAEYEDYQKISSEWKKLSHMQSGFMNSILMGTNISYDKAKGLCIVFTNKFNYELMLRQERMEELRQMLNKQYQKEFSITAKLLEAGEAMPRITRGSHIEGINMEIGVEDE